jgi:hypothetical protein
MDAFTRGVAGSIWPSGAASWKQALAVPLASSCAPMAEPSGAGRPCSTRVDGRDCRAAPCRRPTCDPSSRSAIARRLAASSFCVAARIRRRSPPGVLTNPPEIDSLADMSGANLSVEDQAQPFRMMHPQTRGRFIAGRTRCCCWRTVGWWRGDAEHRGRYDREHRRLKKSGIIGIERLHVGCPIPARKRAHRTRNLCS